MNGKSTSALRTVAAWLLFTCLIGWPAAALFIKATWPGGPPQAGYAFTLRQISLFGKSLGLAGIAALICLAVSLPAAMLIGNLRSGLRRSIIMALLLAVMLCPPMVYAFGWERVWPTASTREWQEYIASARCILVWALWAWPIPAVIIGAGWTRLGRSAYEGALLDANRLDALLQIALPSLRHHIALSALVLIVLFLGNYNVPHACGLVVFSTELLGFSESSNRVIDSGWPALLSIGAVVILLIALYRSWRVSTKAESDSAIATAHRRNPASRWLAAWGIAAISWLLPLGVLVWKLSSTAALVEAIDVYGVDIAWSVGSASVAGVLVVVLGIAIQQTTSLRRFGCAVCFVFGAMPAALIGTALVSAYNHAVTGALYDHWPIVVLSYTLRFAWIGALAAAALQSHESLELKDQARIDGASESAIWSHVIIPLHGLLLFGIAAVVVALSVADVAASSLVRVPDFGPIAHTIFEKFHRMEDDMLISLSLILVGCSLPAVGLLALASALRSSKKAERAISERNASRQAGDSTAAPV